MTQELEEEKVLVEKHASIMAELAALEDKVGKLFCVNLNSDLSFWAFSDRHYWFSPT